VGWIRQLSGSEGGGRRPVVFYYHCRLRCRCEPRGPEDPLVLCLSQLTRERQMVHTLDEEPRKLAGPSPKSRGGNVPS